MINKYFNFNKSQFTRELIKKDKKMKECRYILFMKYVYLKRVINIFQISIIIVSTIITFFESIKNHIFVTEQKARIISICLSTYIAVFTAIFRFLKFDDKKEEINKILQIINDVETLINNKIKSIELLQYRFNDELLILNTSKKLKSECENFDDISCCLEEQNIINKYFSQFETIITNYKNEDIEQKILNAKKYFDSIFSYNEVIYYKGKIIESMLLDKVHNTNRIILETSMDNLKNSIDKISKNRNKLHDIEKFEIEHDIYNDDDDIYNNTFCNNICLYFSNVCKFCLVMNLYLNLSIKQAKLKSLRKKIKHKNNKHNSCCNLVKNMYCIDTICCNVENEIEQPDMFDVSGTENTILNN